MDRKMSSAEDIRLATLLLYILNRIGNRDVRLSGWTCTHTFKRHMLSDKTYFIECDDRQINDSPTIPLAPILVV
jgi:hypothetical protein